MAVIPTNSQPYRQGRFLALLGSSAHTHTHTAKGKQLTGCIASTAVHMSKALWIDVSQWGRCRHVELDDSLLYSNAPTL